MEKFRGDQQNIKYLHDLTFRDDVPVNERVNGHSHVKFINSSETIPVENGKLILGQYKSFGIELDPIRDREIVCSFIKS